MKKIILFFIALILFNPGIQGQSESYTPVKSWSLQGFIGAHGGAMFQGYGEGQKKKIPPSVCFSVDYRLTKVIEMGLHLGWSSAEIFLEDAPRRVSPNAQGSLVYEDVNITALRTSVNLNLLLHYTEKSHLDMYSGIRAGMKYTKRKTDTGFYNYTGISDISNFYLSGVKQKSSSVNLQVVLFGFRHFFNDHFGIGMELAVGAPYYTAVQINYRM